MRIFFITKGKKAGNLMITSRETTVGYHCPFCGMSILNKINIFTMEGNLIKLKCVCGGSELAVQILKDRKYKITAPCILCPNPHTFTLSSAAFFQKDLFSLSCKFTAVNICFIGKSNKVYDALKKNEQELIKTFGVAEELENMEDMEDMDMDEFEDDFYDDDLDDGDDDFWDEDDFGHEKKEPGFALHKNENLSAKEYSIDDIKDIKISSYRAAMQILNIISRMHDKKKIFCKCKNFDGKLTISEKSVRVECKNCGSYRDLKCASASDAEYLGESDRLHLDYDD